MKRRRIRHASIASIVMLPCAAAFAAAPVGSSPFAIGLEPVTSVAGPSLDLTHAGDGTNRIFLAGQNTGDVRIFDIATNTLLTTPFLDVNGAGVTGAALPLATGGERGLLGMAFHPNYANPGQPGYGKFYTYTSENAGTLTPVSGLDFIHDELDGTNAAPANLGDHDSVIREWTVSASNSNQLSMLAADRREILRIRQPQSNHNGGAIKFGPDGMLYIALGDGGGGDDASGTGDQLLTDGHTNASTTVRGNAQDVQDYALARNENVLGKLLRIDPRDPATTPGSIGPASVNGRYRIPADNPRVGATDGADEIWAYGLRNPFRMSFDRVGGGLYVADVGQSALEEVNIVTRGGNYGWVYWEGTNVRFDEPAGLVDIKPIAEYGHADGRAVIGGFLYRGSNIPELYGKYIFGELGWNDPATAENTIVGRIFHMEPGGGAISQFQYLLNSTYDSNAPVIAPNAQLYAFGEDRDGELYAMFANGDVKRILGRQWYARTGGSWGTAANWLGAIPNATGAAANFAGRVPAGLPGVPTITLDGNRTVGSMLFNNDVINPGGGIDYRIAPGTGGTLTLANSTGNVAIQVIKGNHEITAPVSALSNATLVVGVNGSLNVTAPFNVTGSRTLTMIGGGSATLNAVTMQPTSTLAVNSGTLGVGSVTGGGAVNATGGRVNVAVNGTSTGTSKVNALNVTGDGRLDITNNKFIVVGGDIGDFSGGSYDGLTGMIARAYNFGAWDSPGILTSMPAAQQDEATTMVAIALAESVFYAGGTFGGLPVATGDVLLMYTYAGDLNLDGLVDGADYGVIDNSVQFPGTSGYGNGDFNLDGVIDGADYGIIDNTIQLQGDPFPSGTYGGPSASTTAVPEPSACGLAILAALAVRRRRRTANRGGRAPRQPW